jgi:alkylated DNA repair dioxygenase AlkB
MSHEGAETKATAARMPADDVFAKYVSYFPGVIEGGRPFADKMNTLFPASRSKSTFFGKVHEIPRDQVVVFFDQDGAKEDGKPLTYSYSRHDVPVVANFDELERIRQQVQSLTGVVYNFVLINRYKDGKDGVGWHADDERQIDQEKPIASVSFGGSRKFDLRLTKSPQVKTRFQLSHGDLAVMHPGCQTHCQHQVPKQANAQPRLNLTFRVLKPSAQLKRKRDD